MWNFVNFTGTAGVWRASAIETAGGWRACSLVEDCELSFRALFCGYQTRFTAVEVPSELPTSVTAYKAQQKRWTLGWAQLIRMHLGTLLFRYHCSLAKRIHLLYHILLSVQWPLWLAWQVITPWLVALSEAAQPGQARQPPPLDQLPNGARDLPAGGSMRDPSGHLIHVFTSSAHALRGMIYFAPLLLHMFLASTIAAAERCNVDAVVVHCEARCAGVNATSFSASNPAGTMLQPPAASRNLFLAQLESSDERPTPLGGAPMIFTQLQEGAAAKPPASQGGSPSAISAGRPSQIAERQSATAWMTVISASGSRVSRIPSSPSTQ